MHNLNFKKTLKIFDFFKLFDNFEILLENLNRIDFFNFMYDDKFSIIDNSIQHANKNIYFKNIHLFTKRIKNIIIVKKKKLTN